MLANALAPTGAHPLGQLKRRDDITLAEQIAADTLHCSNKELTRDAKRHRCRPSLGPDRQRCRSLHRVAIRRAAVAQLLSDQTEEDYHLLNPKVDEIMWGTLVKNSGGTIIQQSDHIRRVQPAINKTVDRRTRQETATSTRTVYDGPDSANPIRTSTGRTT
jgi:hypothetical protein